MADNPTFKVRLKNGGSMVLEAVAFQPFEPSAYCWEAFWECVTADSDDYFLVYSNTGIVSIGIERPNSPTDTEEEIGYVPAILRQVKKEIRMENELFAREQSRDI